MAPCEASICALIAANAAKPKFSKNDFSAIGSAGSPDTEGSNKPATMVDVNVNVNQSQDRKPTDLRH